MKFLEEFVEEENLKIVEITEIATFVLNMSGSTK
jgi:hypothetical protein